MEPRRQTETTFKAKLETQIALDVMLHPHKSQINVHVTTTLLVIIYALYTLFSYYKRGGGDQALA